MLESTNTRRQTSEPPPMQPGQVFLATNHRRYPPRTRESIAPQPLNPPSIENTTQIHHPRRLSLLESNPLTPTLPSQHRHLRPHPPLRLRPPSPHNPQNRVDHRTPAQCAQFQYDHLHPLVFRSFERSLARADLQSGDKRRLFGFTMPWYAVTGKEKMTISMLYAFELCIVVSGPS